MKKLLTILLVALLSLSLVSAIGCSKPCTEHTYDANGVCTVCQTACTHTGGTATCSAKKVCDECGISYGDLDADNHAQIDEWIKTAQTHKHYYPCCGEDIVAEANHNYVDGVCDVCDAPCSHASFTNEVCDVCGQACAHDNYTNGVCVCGKECIEHDFVEGECSICRSARLLYARTESLLTSEVVNGELVYTLTKEAGNSCSSSYENGYNFNAFWIKNVEDRQFISFDYYSASFNYFQFVSGTGAAFWEFDFSRVTIVNKETKENVALDPTAVNGDGVQIWTGEVLPIDTWLTIFVDVSTVQDLGFVFWQSAEGTSQIKNIKYIDFCASTHSYVQFGLDADGNTSIKLIKETDVSCNQYGPNGWWFDIPEGKTVLTFDLMSPSFNYIGLMAGDGIGWYDTSFTKVTAVNKETNEPVEFSEEIWTGEVLEVNVWYTFTVDVNEMADLGIIYWQSQAGISYIANIQYN